MSTIGKLVVAIVGDTTALQKDIKNIEKDLKRSLGKNALDASKALTASVGALAAVMTGVGIAAVKMAGEMEQSEIAFETMLGSTAKAKEFLGELADFAAKTPFELPGLVDASKRLLAFGFQAEEIIPMMTAIGDAVAGLGGGAEQINRVTTALGQMLAKGKVSAQEMMQLAEQGIPAWQYLADAIGVSIPKAMKMAENGAIDARTGIQAVLAGMRKDFDGLMQKQSESLLGLWSTARDNIGAILRELGFDIIDTFDFKEKLKGANEWLGNFAKELREGGIRQALEKLVPEELQVAIVMVAGAITAAMIPALISLGVALWGAIAPLAPFLAAGAALGALAFTIYKYWEPISEFFTETWYTVVYNTQLAWSKIKEFVLSGVKFVLDQLVKFTSWIPGIGDKIQAASEAINNLINNEKANQQALALDFITAKHERAAERIQKAQEETTKKTEEENRKQIESNKQAAQESAQLLEERAKFEKEWSDRLFEATHDRLEILEKEKQEAIAKAEELGASTADIIAYYEHKKTEIEKKKAEERLKKIEEESQRKADFEKQWTDKLLQETGTRLQVLAAEEAEAIAQAKKIGADTTAIRAYYAQKRLEINKQEQETRKQFEDEWTQKLFEATATREQILEAEKQAALAKAEKLGASKKDILAYYEYEITRIQQEEINKRNQMVQQSIQDQLAAIMTGTSEASNVFQAFGLVVRDIYANMAKDIASSLAKSIMDQNAWLGKTLANIASAISGYISQAYSALVAFFAWMGPFAPAAAAGVIGAALYTMGNLAKQALQAIGLAEGGLVTSPIAAVLGEGDDDEVVMPLTKGIELLAEGLLAKLAQISAFSFNQPALATATPASIQNNSNLNSSIHLHVGVLVADEHGIKQLERRLSKYRIAEAQRRGEEL